MIAVLKRSLGAAALVLAIQSHPFAQATLANNDPDEDFKLAKELYQKEQFSLAYPLFNNISLHNNSASNLPLTTKVEARYYSIVCGLKLNDPAAVIAAREFVDLEHNTPRTHMLSYHLG